MPKDTTPLLYFIMAGLIFSFSLGLYVGNSNIFTNFNSQNMVQAQPTKYFTLELEPVDLQVAQGAVWHAWTFNGTIPGPVLHLTVGDVISVRVINKHNLTHSFHTHLSNYNFTSDGSQANIIAGKGERSMIPPGEDYTYNFVATSPGIYYYHCHSSDHFPISYHIHQGLYGAIIVDEKDRPRVDHDWTIFMSEIGGRVTGSGAPPFIMNGMGVPGGEAALMDLHAKEGFDGVVAQLNQTLSAFSMKLGETARLSIINIGDQSTAFTFTA
jgi:FtsP/CotA-like multicopper oxidase with cupredoxin domain